MVLVRSENVAITLYKYTPFPISSPSSSFPSQYILLKLVIRSEEFSLISLINLPAIVKIFISTSEGFCCPLNIKVKCVLLENGFG